MPTLGYLTTVDLLSTQAERRDDAWEHDLQFQALGDACRGFGIDLVEIAWDAVDLDPAEFDAFVIGTTWDYMENSDGFLARLAELAALRPLFNDLDTVRWNIDKTYLRELETAGVRVVPTRWCDRADGGAIETAFEAFGCDDLVVKPQVGAGAWRQVRVTRGTTLPPADELPPGTAMIQPFLPAIQTEGEYSFIYCGGTFSHCALKCPADGDYRSQAMYGATEVRHEPTAAELVTATAAVRAIPGDLVYARVDMVRDPEGELALMELELVEPYLYPEQGPELGAHYAAALQACLKRMR